MDLYERQLNFVESIVSFHPEFLDIFNVHEQEVFRKYFLPDWDKWADFREYHHFISVSEPEIMNQATELLRRFIAAHKVVHTDLLP